MLTVYNILHEYCQERNLQPPSNNAISNIAKIISHHFRNYWAPHHLNDSGMVENAGFLSQKEGRATRVVTGYPDIFFNDMVTRIDVYFLSVAEKKAAEIAAIEKKKEAGAQRKRKRIPIKEANSKPLNKL